MFLGPSPDFGRFYQTWKEWGDDADKDEIELRRGIETMGQKFVYDFVMDIRYRFQPYWGLWMACEVANPCSPKAISPHAWQAAKDLMIRTGKFTEQDADDTIQNLKDQRDSFKRCSEVTEHRVSVSLLIFSSFITTGL